MRRWLANNMTACDPRMNGLILASSGSWHSLYIIFARFNNRSFCENLRVDLGKNIYCNNAQGVEIFPHGSIEPTYFAFLMPLMLMIWWCMQTLQKLLSFCWTDGEFKPDFGNIKHGEPQESTNLLSVDKFWVPVHIARAPASMILTLMCIIFWASHNKDWLRFIS